MTRLDLATAERFASIALANIRREFPHKLDHVMASADDARTPRELHPAFHGCFDWHSCVHMHWLLVRTLRRFPALRDRADVVALLDENLRPAAIAAEIAYLGRPESAGFERPYGFAWLLKLACELHAADDRDACRWRALLTPLADTIAARLHAYASVLRYPVRHGTHANTAFALVFALDYARVAGDDALAIACTECALAWYGHDQDAAAAFEPSGIDFLSPVLVEAELMRRVLGREAFASWLARFLPRLEARSPAPLFEPAHVGPDDRSDGHLVHLDGLNLSRAWCLRGIAMGLPKEDSRTAIARRAADEHLTAGLQGLHSDDFVGTHWLATFAMLALDDVDAV